MPSKNIIKPYIPNTYYHVYNRGVNKAEIFLDDQDNATLLSLFDRYLNIDTTQVDSNKLPYQKFNSIELNSYCLMRNHFHLLIHLGSDVAELPCFMRSLGTSYTAYFNKKYARVGPLFQSRYKASALTSQEQLAHLTRYIHLNPKDFLDYRYSSVANYLGSPTPNWLEINRVLNEISIPNYLDFLKSA